MAEVRIVTAADLVENVPTPGMERREAVAGTTRIIAVRTRPGLVSGCHHMAATRPTDTSWPDAFDSRADRAARRSSRPGSGDFFIVPPDTIHRESNPSAEEQVIVGFRIGDGPTVINVDGPEGSGR